eukprot:1176684-Prorocentrum_minimum.AAC.3
MATGDRTGGDRWPDRWRQLQEALRAIVLGPKGVPLPVVPPAQADYMLAAPFDRWAAAQRGQQATRDTSLVRARDVTALTRGVPRDIYARLMGRGPVL